MNNYKWSKRVILSSLFGISFVILFNYIINPYHVFLHEYYSNFLKVKDNLVDDEMSKFYAAKKANPDVIMVGTSRVEHLNPKYLQPYVKGKIFNVAVKGSGLSTQYKLIKYFVTKGNVKSVVLGLDFYAFSPANVGDYKSISNSRFDDAFFSDYKTGLLSFRTLRKSISTLKDNLKKKHERIQWDTGWDSYSYEYLEFKQNNDQWHFKKIESGFPNFGINSKFFGNESFKKPSSIDKGLKILDEIITLCKKNNVELKLFTTPLYYRVYDVINERGYQKTYNYWKQELSQYGLVYDFNYKNEITKSYKNYVDSSHFKSEVGEYIFKRIYSTHSENFGILLKNQ